MTEIVSEKVVRPSRRFLTFSFHARRGPYPVSTQTVLTDTICTHGHRGPLSTIINIRSLAHLQHGTHEQNKANARRASALRPFRPPLACVDFSSLRVVSAARPPATTDPLTTAPPSRHQHTAPAHRSLHQPSLHLSRMHVDCTPRLVRASPRNVPCPRWTGPHAGYGVEKHQVVSV